MSSKKPDPQKRYWIIIYILVPILIAFIALLKGAPTPENVKQQTKYGHNFNNIAGNITIGLSFKDHEEDLKRREKEIRDKLQRANDKDKHILREKLYSVEQDINALKESYKKRIKYLQDRIIALENFKDQFPSYILEEALIALGKADQSIADDLFRQVEERAQVSINQAAEAAYQRGVIAKEQQRFFDSYNHFFRAAELAPNELKYLLNVGDLANRTFRVDEASEFYEKALKVSLVNLGTNNPDIVYIYHSLGSIYSKKRYYSKAMKQYEKALNISRKNFGNKHPNVAISLHRIGNTWSKKGDSDKAIVCYDKALDILLNNFSLNHSGVVSIWQDLGEAWANKGNYDNSINYYEKALNVYLNNSNYSSSEKSIRVLYALSFDWLAKGDCSKAIDFYVKALDISIKLFGKDRYPDGTIFGNLESLLSKKYDRGNVIEYLERALNIFLDYYDKLISNSAEQYAFIPHLLEYLGNARFDNGDYDNAIKLYEKALNFRLKFIDGNNHPDIIRNRHLLMKALAQKDNCKTTQ